MARSYRIYLVFQDGQEDPRACFTVKHEAFTWIRENIEQEELTRYWLCGTPDGGYFENVTVWDGGDGKYPE